MPELAMCVGIKTTRKRCGECPKLVRLWLYYPVPYCVAHQPGDRMDPELRHQPGAMRFGGFLADPEGRSDFFIAATLAQQLQHFPLARRQPIERPRGDAPADRL